MVLTLVACFGFFSAGLPIKSETAGKRWRIVLDPGHGGSDQGTRHGGLQESELVLQISLKLASKLRQKGYWVGLTRERDRDVRLRDRFQFANHAKADLFLSLHVNAAPIGVKVQPSGFESYVLASEGLKTSKRLALFKDLPAPLKLRAEGLDAGGRHILRDHQLDQNRFPSHQLAGFIQKELETLTSGTAPRAVREDLFFVLLGTDMPSVLLELGFLEDPTDRRRLQELEGQRRMVDAIVRGLEVYLEKAVKPL